MKFKTKYIFTSLLLTFLLSYTNIASYAERGVKVTSVANTERRIALVIGNSAYKSSPLMNPVNDATDMAAKLRRLGFQVSLGKDWRRKEMRTAIRNFGKELRLGGVGLFYYAGHGMQVNGKNYLIPIGTDIGAEYEVQDEAVDAGQVLRSMENAGNTMNMVFLDACRNNPFARSFRSTNKGLAQMDAPSGSLIVYATAPGSVAADGSGRNGIFTKNLLSYLDTPDEVGQMLRKVRVSVREETGGKQTPWESSSLEGNFYFMQGTKASNLPSPDSSTSSLEAMRLKLQEERRHLEEEKRIMAERQKLAEERERMELEAERKSLEEEKKLLGEKQRVEEERRKLAAEKEQTRDVPDFLGTWHWSVASILVPDRINRVLADGTCTLNDVKGTWHLADENPRKIIFYWSGWYGNWTHTMVLSKDGKTMSGKDDLGTRVTGKKTGGLLN